MARMVVETLLKHWWVMWLIAVRARHVVLSYRVRWALELTTLMVALWAGS